MQMFSVFDKAVGAYMPPFFARTRGEAIRMFSDAVQSKDGQFIKHPQDYELYEIAVWDDLSGRCEQTAEHPARLLTATECREE